MYEMCEHNKNSVDYDYIVKTIIVGDSDTGKSSMMTQVVDGVFSPNRNCTIGVDYKTLAIDSDFAGVKFLLWDTAGQERFKNITRMYYRGAQVVIFVYDITDKKSFTNIIEWIQEIDSGNQENPIKILVGNKLDLESMRKVSISEAQEFSNANGFMGFYEISAKDNIGIKEAFEEIAEFILTDTSKIYKKRNRYTLPNIPNIKKQNNKNNGCGC